MIPEIIKTSKQKIAEICKKYGIRELSLFGSRIGNSYTVQSDFDFLVEFQPETEIGLIKFLKIQTDLEKIVGDQVDLVSKKGLKPEIREKVLSEIEVIYVCERINN